MRVEFSMIQKRLASLSGDQQTQARELLSRFPVNEQEDHLEAFEMQQGRVLSRETLAAFANYVRLNGGEATALGETLKTDVKMENSMPQLSSSIVKAATPVRVVVDNVVKTFGSGNRVFGVALDKASFRMNISNSVARPYRFMDQSVEAKAQAQSWKTSELSEQIQAASEVAGLAAAVASLASLKIGGEENQLLVGRIVAETEDRLNCLMNLQTLLLEDTLNSGGRRTRLIVENPDCGVLFPGQVVGAVGRVQRGGQEFHAVKIIPGVPPVVDQPGTAQPGQPCTVCRSFATKQSLHVAVAAGPFTPKDSLDFGCLEALTEFVANYKPHMLVLLGPFVDSGNSVISTGAVVDAAGNFVSFEELYEKEVKPRIASLAAACNAADARLVILPALNELACDFPLPQPPLDWAKENNALATVHFAANPCFIEASDIKMAVTSSDVLLSLMSEALVVGQGKNKLDGCLEQLLWQQTLFPGNSASLPLDPSHRPLLKTPATPDVVLFSSPATQIAKLINNTLFVNPGAIAKGGAGTLANLFVDAHGDEPEKRVRADIVKLVA